MAVMSDYCKAYTVDQLRQWTPLAVTLLTESDAAGGASYYFLHDDYTVTSGIFRDQKVAFDRVTDEWRTFCANVLEFHPPRAIHG